MKQGDGNIRISPTKIRKYNQTNNCAKNNLRLPHRLISSTLVDMHLTSSLTFASVSCEMEFKHRWRSSLSSSLGHSRYPSGHTPSPGPPKTLCCTKTPCSASPVPFFFFPFWETWRLFRHTSGAWILVFGDAWILELAVHAYYSQISHFTIEV